MQSKDTKSIICPYCSEVIVKENGMCPLCHIPLEDVLYRQPWSNTSGGLDFDLDAILFNIENEAEKPKPVTIKRSSGADLQIKPILDDCDFVRHYIDWKDRISTHCNLDNYTVIDFETANMYPDSICQIGIAVVDVKKIVYANSFLIRPPYNDFRNKKIHGITLEDVKDSPTFIELWDSIKPYLHNRLVGAYNAKFDIGCLDATLQTYGMKLPDFATFDILQNARETWKDKGFYNFKLQTVAGKLGINYDAHDAKSDAVTAAKVQIATGMKCTYSAMYDKNQNHTETMSDLIYEKNTYTRFKKKYTIDSNTDWCKFFSDIKNFILYKRFDADDILLFCKGLSKEKDCGYDVYKDLLNVLEEFVLKSDSPILFQYFGMVLENCLEKEKAISFYRLALEMDGTLRLKTRIAKLEKQLKK